ncbi:hypothetical protein HCN44_002463 [Aphidius gifuensis]|uniref:Peptidase S1 domain-containing protein n=1 Tax=Aphidius gifuensis TaxID=684658 RepID=A0A834Y4V1_APHGI|nr:kallikrein-1-like [Aphidius gifuensis]KAF7996817.1 hypothetical protein HCN44_002463 [Aphidius gifuensis]
MFIQCIFFLSLFINKVFSDDYMPVNRIVNALPAELNQFPYQVSISLAGVWGVPFIISQNPICSGSIIHPRWILTSAYCVYELTSKDRILVQAGKNFINEATEPYQQNRFVNKVYLHPSYPGENARHDIALLTLDKPLSINQNVMAVNLPAPEVVYLGEGIVAGWGSTSFSQNTELSTELRYDTVPIIEHDKCNEILKDKRLPLQVFSEQICTGSGIRNSAVCNGDSGGPLVTKEKLDGYHVQIGIISWGLFPCGKDEIGAVYTRVSCYIDWIDDIVLSDKDNIKNTEFEQQ